MTSATETQVGVQTSGGETVMQNVNCLGYLPALRTSGILVPRIRVMLLGRGRARLPVQLGYRGTAFSELRH